MMSRTVTFLFYYFQALCTKKFQEIQQYYYFVNAPNQSASNHATESRISLALPL